MFELQGEKLFPELEKLEQRLRIATVVRMLDGRLMIAKLVIDHAEPDNRK